ncbi:MAG: DUF3343 domain-containing protein [Christensenellaceae bacterium]|jgi:hypothetical protein|nr:DUF3343 domain-containing protein [Christensenellaceae bacterium]
MQYLATFYTHFAALSFHRRLRERGVPGRMMPAPRKVSVSCGSCVTFETEGDFHALLVEDTEAVYHISKGQYAAVYRHEDT